MFIRELIDKKLNYEIKLSIFINNLLNSELLKDMKHEEIDDTVLLLLKNADLKSYSGELLFNNKETRASDSFCIAESLMTKRLPKSLEFYFDNTKNEELYQDAKVRAVICTNLQKIFTYEIKNEDYLTLNVILSHLPNSNIFINNLTLLTNIIRLNLSNAKIYDLIKTCSKIKNFDYYVQNSDGSYFFEKYISDMIKNAPTNKSLEERMELLTHILEIDDITYNALSYLKGLPEIHRKMFEKIISCKDLQTKLPIGNTSKLIKI